jgi:hypothetical protein
MRGIESPRRAAAHQTMIRTFLALPISNASSRPCLAHGIQNSWWIPGGLSFPPELVAFARPPTKRVCLACAPQRSNAPQRSTNSKQTLARTRLHSRPNSGTASGSQEVIPLTGPVWRAGKATLFSESRSAANCGRSGSAASPIKSTFDRTLHGAVLHASWRRRANKAMPPSAASVSVEGSGTDAPPPAPPPAICSQFDAITAMSWPFTIPS